MTRVDRAARVQRYLDSVELVGWALTEEERRDLVADLEDRIGHALAGSSGDVDVERVLAELGAPVEVVREVEDRRGVVSAADHGLLPQPPARPERVTPIEVGTIVALLLAGALVLAGPLVVALHATAATVAAGTTRWRGTELLVAILLPVPTAVPGMLWFRAFTDGACREVLPALVLCPGLTELRTSPSAWAAALLCVVLVIAGVRLLVTVVRGRPVED